MTGETGSFMRAALVALALLVPGAVAAQEAPRDTTAKREHVVRRGDTLWDLARRYFQDPYRWPVLYDANRRVVENPHWIYPLERLIIPGLERGRPTRVLGVEFAAMPADQMPDLPQADEVVDATVLTELTPERPIVLPAQFHTAPWLQDTTAMSALARVVRVVDPRTEGEQLERSAFPFERVYVKHGRRSVPVLEEKLLIVRVTRDVAGWGQMLEPVGVLSVTEVADDVFTGRVIAQYGPVEPAAYVMPIDSFPLHPGMEAGTVTHGPEGRIVAFESDLLLPGLLDRGFVNVGRAHGVGVGDELEAYIPARRLDSRVGTVTVPSESVARLRVIRVSERSATFAIVEVREPLLEPGLPVRLVRAVR